jgi:hypothetical protein
MNMKTSSYALDELYIHLSAIYYEYTRDYQLLREKDILPLEIGTVNCSGIE